MNFKIGLLSVLAGLSLLTNMAFAGGGPHERPSTCQPGTPVVTPPHTAVESLVQILLGKNQVGGFSTLEVYASFDGRETRKEGPGCATQIIEVGTPTVHVQYTARTANYDVVEQNDYTTGDGITVEPIWENSGRVIGARYFNSDRQELLNVVCKPNYAKGGTGTNVPGKANGVINGIVLNNADVTCQSIAWVTNLPR